MCVCVCVSQGVGGGHQEDTEAAVRVAQSSQAACTQCQTEKPYTRTCHLLVSTLLGVPHSTKLLRVKTFVKMRKRLQYKLAWMVICEGFLPQKF